MLTPIKLYSIDQAPEPLRSALYWIKSIPIPPKFKKYKVLEFLDGTPYKPTRELMMEILQLPEHMLP